MATLHEVYKNAEDWDLLKRKQWPRSDAIYKKGVIDREIAMISAVADDWVIIPTGPVPMTAEQISDAVRDMRDFDLVHSREDRTRAAQLGLDHGRWVEWLRPEQVELRDAVAALADRCDRDGLSTLTERVLRAAESLQPPPRP